MTNKTTNPINKGKVAVLLIFPFLLIGLGIYSYLSPEVLASKADSFDKVKITGIVGAVIGLFLAIMIIVKWIAKKTGIEMDESGIIDYSNASYAGLVEWKDITKVEARKGGPIPVLVLHVSDPDKYIKLAKKSAFRQLSKNQHHFGSPIIIVNTRLKIKFQEMAELVSKEFNKFKGA